MIYLNSVVAMLEEAQEKVEKSANELEKKQAAIEDKAFDRNMTDMEEEKFADLDLEISDLQEESDALEDAISELKEFCE